MHISVYLQFQSSMFGTSYVDPDPYGSALWEVTWIRIQEVNNAENWP